MVAASGLGRRAGVCVALGVVASLGSAGAALGQPTPAPYPSGAGGAEASAWRCEDRVKGQPVGSAAGQDCAVTQWAPRSTPQPYPTLVVPAPVVSVAPTASTGLPTDQWAYVSFALAVLVFIAAAGLVGGWGRNR